MASHSIALIRQWIVAEDLLQCFSRTAAFALSPRRSREAAGRGRTSLHVTLSFEISLERAVRLRRRRG